MIVTFSLLFLLLQFCSVVLNLAEAKHVDVIGNFDLLFEKQMGEVVKQTMVIDETSCKPQLVKIGEIQFFSSTIPSGICNYCCPFNKHHHYVKAFIFQNCTSYSVIHKLVKGKLRQIGLNSTLPTAIYIHGFGEGAQTPNSQLLCNAYFSRVQAHNVIFIDWSELATIPWYQQAIQNIDYVKKFVTNFIKFYAESGEIMPSNLHIIGFSLGAQVAGGVGKNFQETNKISRITGLDPAFPSFSLIDEKQRLAKGDAMYVDIIHTDAGKFGFPISIGDVDFYPNGGMFPQPGCLNKTNTYGACDHMRAIELYAESVENPEAFPVKSENGVIYMGFPAMDSKVFGNITLSTNDHSPYGINNITV